MTSNTYAVPSQIEPELAALLDGGIGKITPPTLKEATLGDDDKTKIFQIWCHSPRVWGNSLGLCNHSLGAIICDIKGESTFPMLVECPKCRTAYALVVHIKEGGLVELISSKVVNLNRATQLFVDTILDKEKDTWIQVHEKK